MKFSVEVAFEGGLTFEINAKNEEEAKEAAEKMFDNTDDREIVTAIGNISCNAHSK